jgi:ribosomal protein S18 acetylase RimI-like enzyme
LSPEKGRKDAARTPAAGIPAAFVRGQGGKTVDGPPSACAEVLPVCIQKDCEEIARLLCRAFADSGRELGLTPENCPQYVGFMTPERLLRQLGAKDAVCLGIQADGAWVGFVAVAPYRNSHEITRLAVAPEYRHRGYGRRLMDAACDRARAMGLTEIGLGVAEANKRLKRWYEAQGFVPGEPFAPPGLPFAVCGMLKKL